MNIESYNVRLSQGVTESRPIVCDTMIWYEVGKGTINRDHLRDLHLVGNLVSVLELITTPNVERYPQCFIKHPLVCMMELCSEVRLMDPFSFAYQKMNPSYVPQSELLMRSITNWIDTHPSETHGLDPRAYLKNSHFRNGMAKNYVESFSTYLPKLRGELKDRRFRSQFKKDSLYKYRMAARDFFEAMSVNLSINIDKKVYPWQSIDPYLAGLSYYYGLIGLDSNLKIDPNDERDLQILLYVNPDELYWTLEKRWNTALKKNGLSRYIFLEETH